MPRRIDIVHRVVGGVGVQVLRPWAVCFALERILLQESACVRVIVPAAEIVCPAVVQRSPCKLDVVYHRACALFDLLFFVPKRIVDVFFCPVQASVLRPYQVCGASPRIIMINPVKILNLFS